MSAVVMVESGNPDFLITAKKDVESFRNYKNSDRQAVVAEHYRLMRANQTLEFTRKMSQKYDFSDGKYRKMMTIREAFKELMTYVDSSDPDAELPNRIHMLQTAEGLRKAGHPDWMQIVGLIHDMGKVMFLWGTEEDGQLGRAEGPQWALGGDTWVAGCALPDCCVFPELNSTNPDMADPRYNTECGIHQRGCGFEKLEFAYGHDEYLYQMLLGNNIVLPVEGMAMIRYHSCYPWHTGGAYRQFMTDEDHTLLKWVLEFNKCDLYTKDNDVEEFMKREEELWAYYEPILEKYGMGGALKW
jgi:inositol oxygenase